MIPETSQQYQYFRFPNGIRLIHRESAGAVAHAGLMIDTGTRDELPGENGMAHLIEHMMFKGTKKRKAYHVLSRLEHIGGDLNAFTTKEETCIHASFISPYYERVIELFSDIFFHSTFPEQELEKEKDVIIDEIKSYKDSPAEEILDEFENLLFHGHPIGRNILGSEENLLKFTRNDIVQFIHNNYSTEKIVIASVGTIKFEVLKKLINKYFEGIGAVTVSSNREVFLGYEPGSRTEIRHNYLSHCMIGNVAYNRKDPKKHALILLNNILGGQGLNSRLNLNIREKYGFTYTIESQFSSYSDTGMFAVYFGTDPKSVSRTISLVHKELEKLRNEKIGSLQLHRAKLQLIGQLAINFESGLTEMLSIARSHLLFDKVDNMEEVIRKINNLTAEQLLEAANRTFDPLQLSTLLYEGRDESEK
ncbi:MAG: insulinase family protein [Bacteroidales bacterium]|nr:insulinase family protein [Bacteroidales bacterium]